MCLPKKKLARSKLRFEKKKKKKKKKKRKKIFGNEKKKKKKKMPQIFRSRHTNMTDYCLTN